MIANLYQVHFFEQKNRKITRKFFSRKKFHKIDRSDQFSLIAKFGFWGPAFWDFPSDFPTEKKLKKNIFFETGPAFKLLRKKYLKVLAKRAQLLLISPHLHALVNLCAQYAGLSPATRF